MRILIITCCIIILNFINTNAQNKSKLNLELSITPIGYSNIIQKSEAGDKINNNAKLTYGFGVDINFLIKNETKIVFRPNISSLGYQTNQSTSKARVQYLVVPVVLEFLLQEGNWNIFSSHKKKYVLGFGVYGGSALFGNYQLAGGSKTKFNFGESASDNLSVLDFGFVLQLGAIIPHLGVKTMLQARLGQNNVIPDARVVGKSSMKTSSVNWSISIPLSKIKK